MTRTTHLLYLHGFRSGPKSSKAQRMAAWVAANRPDLVWHCPQLPPSPAEAVRGALEAVRDWPDATSAVVGSSLGGFYARHVAARRGWRAMLLNPAVDPARDLAAHVGEQRAFHTPEERFFFRAEFIAELRALEVPAWPDPARAGAVVAKGDELLDWVEMLASLEPLARDAGAPADRARIRLLPGGDHALSDFDEHLPFVLGFLHLQP